MHQVFIRTEVSFPSKLYKTDFQKLRLPLYTARELNVINMVLEKHNNI